MVLRGAVGRGQRPWAPQGQLLPAPRDELDVQIEHKFDSNMGGSPVCQRAKIMGRLWQI